MGKTEISPFTGDEYLLTKLAPTPNVILSQQRRICAQVEDDTALFEIHFGFLVVPLIAQFHDGSFEA